MGVQTLDMAQSTVDSPAPRAIFPDGRMAPKDAWNYCRALCTQLGRPWPTLAEFKKHLEKDRELGAELKPNPFGGRPAKVWAVRPEKVRAFAESRVAAARAPETQEKKTVHRATGDGASRKPARASSSPGSDAEMLVSRAFDYLCRRVGRRADMNLGLFRLYLDYDLIPSRRDGNVLRVRRGDIDAFLDLAPDGVYANNISYQTAAHLTEGQFPLKDAYDYYADIDPRPLTLNTFRSLVAAGIIQPIRMADDPRSPVVGVSKREVDAFLALRQRLMEEQERARNPETFLGRKEREMAHEPAAASEVSRIVQSVVAEAEPRLEAARERAEQELAAAREKEKPPRKGKKRTSPRKKPSAKKARGRWVPIKEAYVYYRTRAAKPLTESWFRNKCYTTDLFGKQVLADERPNNPTGKYYLIDLDSVDAHIEGHSPPKPRSQQAWPVDKAYEQFRELIPPGLTAHQFKHLVREGLIESFKKRSVVLVRLEAVERYFGEEPGVDADQQLQMAGAYDYYCSRCADPVAKAHFCRWVTGGDIEGAEKTGDGLWSVTVAAVDAFLEKFPTGRMRTNRNSRVALNSSKGGRRKSRLAEMAAQAAKTEPPSLGRVSVSLSSYPSRAEMKKAVALLASEGFEVDVKP